MITESPAVGLREFVTEISRRLPESDCLVAEFRANAATVKYVDRQGNELASVVCDAYEMDLMTALTIASRASRDRPRTAELSTKIRRLLQQIRAARSDDDALVVVARFLSVAAPSITAMERRRRSIAQETRRREQVECDAEKLRLRLEEALDEGLCLPAVVRRALDETDFASK